MKRKLVTVLFLTSIFISCIGEDLIDDRVDPVIRITSYASLLTVGNAFQFEAKYFDNVGTEVSNPAVQWSSSDTTRLQIDTTTGLATALKAGAVIVTATITTEENQAIHVESELVIQESVTLMEDEQQEDGEQIRITNALQTIATATAYTLEVVYVNAEGEEIEPSEVMWISSNPEILTVDENGALYAIATGTATITVIYTIGDNTFQDTNYVEVIPFQEGMASSYTGTIRTTSSYVLEGSFKFGVVDGVLTLEINEDYKASSSLPGLYIYLSNNNATTADAYEIAPVTVFEGAHSYTLPESIGLMDYQYILYWCKPFNVKVGEAKIYE